MQILRNYSSQAQILGTPNTTLARAATALLVERPVPARGGFWAVLAHFAVFASDLGLCRVYNVLADVRTSNLFHETPTWAECIREGFCLCQNTFFCRRTSVAWGGTAMQDRR